jgi:hypothetical protein
MRDDDMASRLDQIARVLDVPVETFADKGARADREGRSLAEDILEAGHLLAGLSDPLLRRQCLALLENYVTFQRARCPTGAPKGYPRE